MSKKKKDVYEFTCAKSRFEIREGTSVSRFVSKASVLVFCFIIPNTAFSSEPYDFTELMKMYALATSLEDEAIESEAPGKNMSGEGVVADVAKCGLWDNQWCIGGYKLVLRSPHGRAHLYYPPESLQKIKNLKKGSTFHFKDCEIDQLQYLVTDNYVYCHMDGWSGYRF